MDCIVYAKNIKTVKTLALREDERLAAGAAEVAQFELLVAEQHIFNLDVTMRDRRRLGVHVEEASADVLQDMDSLCLT